MIKVPCRVTLQGDKECASNFIGPAKSQLRILENEMSFQKLKQGTRRVWLNTRTLVTALVCFSLSEVIIYCVPIPVKAVEKEVVEIPIILCGTSSWSEVIYSKDRGKTWETSGVTIGSNNQVRCLSYLGEGKVVGGVNWRTGTLQNHFILSEDYGETWTDGGILYPGVHYTVEIYRLINFGDGIVVGGFHMGYPNTTVRSTDYGVSWSQRGLILPACTIEYVYGKCVIGDGVAMLSKVSTGLDCEYNTIHRTTDYGVSWTQVTNPLGNDYLIYCFAYLGNGIVIGGSQAPSAGGGVYDPAHIIRSEDYGVTWTDMGEQSASEILVLLNLGGGKVIAGTYVAGELLESEDYGITWTKRSGVISGDRFGFEMIDAGEGVLLSTTVAGWLKRSTDSGKTWEHVGDDQWGFYGRAALCLECFYK